MMTDVPKLRTASASAALLVLEDGRYVLQLRDDKPEIWYPAHWGCFGGAADPGEEPVETLRREMREELALEIGKPRWFTRFVFDLRAIGSIECKRDYFIVEATVEAFATCRLGEGAAVEAFTAEVALRDLRLVPYDSFAIFLHSQRGRFTEEGSSAQLPRGR
jgi:8-oxo-dGTP pyrophosphatase MutT (NUDIX family)